MKTGNANNYLAENLGKIKWGGKNILMIIPDRTRTAPVAEMVRIIHPILCDSGLNVDLIIALGTHQPLSREEILLHLKTDEETFKTRYGKMKVMNHCWNRQGNLVKIGEITVGRIHELTDGLMKEKVDLTINKIIKEYDHLLILGPVFPHEVAGFSGGSKYLFPGISGPEMVDFTHWMGAIITNMRIIGNRENPVRKVLDEAASMVPLPVSAVSMVVHDGQLAHLSVGPLLESWNSAAEHSERLHIVRKGRRFRRVLSCAPSMYEDMWTGGKCMYKCEPVVEDGGELVIYAPHINSFSLSHGHVMNKIGYHVRDYYLQQMGNFKDIPKAAMAVSTYLKGAGTFENGVEMPRIKVTLATGIGKKECENAGLAYMDPKQVALNEWKGREDEGVLFVARGGETLYLP